MACAARGCCQTDQEADATSAGKLTGAAEIEEPDGRFRFEVTAAYKDVRRSDIDSPHVAGWSVRNTFS
jgi:hypothetical protein